MKVVFDTNILVSALVFPGGRADIALRRIIEGADQLLLSKPILDELWGSLRVNFPRHGLAHVAVFLSDLSVNVKPRRKLTVLADEPDNRILECAVTGGAHVVVTGDKAILALKNFRKVKLLSHPAYLDEAICLHRVAVGSIQIMSSRSLRDLARGMRENRLWRSLESRPSRPSRRLVR